mgnify:CR=1 FL=1
MSEKIVVTGTGPVGLSAALDLSIKGFETVLVGDKRHYNRDDLYSSGEIDFLDLEALLEKSDIEFVDENVEAYRPKEKIVETSEDDITYDTLVVAERGSIESPGFSLDYTDNFYSPEAREEALDNLKEGKAAVIGAGLEGTKIGTFLQSNGYDTTLIDSSTRPLKDESEDVSKRFLNFFNRTDLSFRGGSEIKEITSYGIEFKNDKELEIENMIWAGSLSASEVVQKAFKCGKNGINVNRGLSASGFDSVYAGGESADVEETDFYGKASQGRLIAENISNNSELLEKYSTEKSKLFKAGKHGVMIKNDKAYIHKALTYLVKARKVKYRIKLKIKSFRA